MKKESLDFETEGVTSLFKKILIPTLLGTVSVSAVTAIDGIFVGHGVGADGVAAVNIVVPLFQIMTGIGLMAGVGCSVTTSILLAKQDITTARMHITQSLTLTSVFTIVLCLIPYLIPHHTAHILGTSLTLESQVLDYMKWIIPSFLFEMWSMIGLFIIRLDGAPRYAMWCNIVPALLNIVLDYLFIFPLDMGVKGAAIATSISVMTGGVMALVYLTCFASTLRIKAFRINKENIKSSLHNVARHCKIGSSSMFGELTLASLIFTGNIVFMKYLGDDGVGAFGIACYYTPFFFMVGNAIAQSAQPIISYNYGLNRRREIIQARRLLLITSFVTGIVVAVLFMFIPEALVALFVDVNGKAGQIAAEGFPYFATGIIFFILNVAVIGYYQSVEQIKKATWFVFLRGFIILIPVFFLLPEILGEKGIWLSMPAAEAMTSFIMFVVYLRIHSKS